MEGSHNGILHSDRREKLKPSRATFFPVCSHANCEFLNCLFNDAVSIGLHSVDDGINKEHGGVGAMTVLRILCHPVRHNLA
jgi:hypothetical protein